MEKVQRLVKTTITICLAALAVIGAAYLHALWVFGEATREGMLGSVCLFMVIYSMLRVIDFVQWAWKVSE